MKFTIDKVIFEKFPSVRLGVVVAIEVDNKKSETTLNFLRQEEKVAREKLSNTIISEHEFIAPWRTAYRDFGSKPNEFSSSVEALAKRVQKGKELPDINPLVNLYNGLSLKYFLPFGGEDLDKVKGDIRLAFAIGTERGKYIGSDKEDACYSGEVAYLDELGFICRRWNWREADRTKLMKETKNVVLVAEALPPVSDNHLKQATEELGSLIRENLGGRISIFYLDQHNPTLEIDFTTGTKLAIPEINLSQKKIVSKERNDNLKTQKKLVTKITQPPKSYFGSAKIIYDQIKKELQSLGFSDSQIFLEHPAVESHGDYSSNIALTILSSLRAKHGNLNFSSPRQLAEFLAENLKKNSELQKLVSKIDVAGPGFINFTLLNNILVEGLKEVTTMKNAYGSSDWGRGKKWLIEHTSPNPNKAMHLGHLRNNVTGMAIANIWEFIGIAVVRDCIDNNRGIAIAKLMWGYLKFARKDKKEMVDIDYWFNHQDEWLTPEDAKIRPDRFVDELYVKASADFDKNEDTQSKVRQLVIDWENKDEKNWCLWRKVLSYSYLGQQLTLKRLGNKWNKIWHEHEHYQKGKDLVTLGLKKGVFKKGKNGAIITDLKKFNIPDTVVIKADGTALYITQDLALTKLKKETFHPDALHWVIGPEQSLALKQMFASCDKLGIINYKNCIHIAYGYMSLKGKGKMSSREGTVIYIDDLIDQVKKEIVKKISSAKFQSSEIDGLSENLALGAIKYSILKVGRLTNTAFDLDESISIDGNSGPYLQYTYARCQSVLSKSPDLSNLPDFPYSPNPEELSILRWIYRFPEVVQEAAAQYSPNLVCTFLYELAQRFNTFYNKHRILESNEQKTENNEQVKFRLMLTSSVAQVLKNGLTLLGIQAPETM